jgi:sarcosine oxidase delta subunit
MSKILETVEEVEDVEVCPYCGNDRDNKFQCCGENHWIKLSEMEDE